MRSRGELLDTLAKNLGGRTAEELVFGEVTTGARGRPQQDHRHAPSAW